MEQRKRSWWRVALTLTIHFSLAHSLSANRNHPHSHGSRTPPPVLAVDTSPVVSPDAAFAFLRARDEQPVDYTCSATRECINKACCGESNVCGYGPTYCGDGCQSHCDATAECGQYSDPVGITCPLNVCCSQFGFCGTTDDFCKDMCQSNCGSVSSPSSGGDVRNRIIGYYESWANTKQPCGQMQPEQIPVDGLTHVNFAFAYIDTETLDIITMDNTILNSLFARVTDIKLRNPALKVWVSIGGWTFNDDGPYQSVFGDIASSTPLTRMLAGKLINFCSKYGFDGVDLDWEYPGAPDRGGKNGDTKNYSRMLSTIKSAFDRSTRPLGLSITVPTSYWYLRWFDLPGIAKSINWFNLMTYDLHGVWDRGDPIGPYVYAHTNLTEIDSALDLFWRSDIDPQMINLGLGFYGRSFQLDNPDCSTPGCKFSGPGAPGLCTDQAGILSYREIRDIIDEVGLYSNIYDKEAGVMYMTYGRNAGNNWISYDDATTFQAKIDFANERGLAGLFIWAVDQDDDALDALRAVTGKNLELSPPLSDTYGAFDIDKCYITTCGGTCSKGDTTMVHTNLDKNRKGCEGKDHQQRSFCCPPFSAPDPSTCRWRGSGPFCRNSFCETGTEVEMFIDDYGGASGCYFGGTKSWCCPVTNGQEDISQCYFDKTLKCSDPNKPQNLTYVTFGFPAGGPDGPGVILYRDLPLCCPAHPEFKNCAWHGRDGDCTGNRCPTGQVQVRATSNHHGGPGEGGKGCSLGREQVFCCDPPALGSAFLPVPLENLFADADTFDKAWTPIFEESIDHSPDQVPNHSPITNDPNKESFAWVIIVGAEEDVTSFEKRDGSHLELYDCPTPHESDYAVQSLKVVCMSDSPENNCEDIMKGGVKGTVVRMPAHCSVDTYVRAVSFRESKNATTMPSHLRKRLEKRSGSHNKVYDFHYDWNFKQLRRGGGAVHFRSDVSNHPGYWDEVVAKDNDSPVKRNAETWREVDKRFVKANDPESWYKRFLSLITTKDVGLLKTYKFEQALYEGFQSCGPNHAASVTIDASGDVTTTEDFGQTIIGTLNDFNFAQAFAFYRQSDFKAHISGGLQAHARIRLQTPLKNIDGHDFRTFGGNFNIKGILRINPYFDLRTQIQAEAITSIQGTVDVTLTSGMFHYMFPETLESIPTNPLNPFKITTAHSNLNNVSPIVGAVIGGQVTISVVPVLGINVEIDAFGHSSKTNIEAVFRGDVQMRFAASASTSCVGFILGATAGFAGTLAVKGAAIFPGWVDDTYTLINKYGHPLDNVCIPYGGGIDASKRSIANATYDAAGDLGGSTKALLRRQWGNTGAGSVFPDPDSNGVYCPDGDMNDDPVSCKTRGFSDVITPDDPDDYNDSPRLSQGGLAKRSLEKRAGNKVICSGLDIVGNDKMTLIMPGYPSAGTLLGNNPNVATYAPLVVDDCNDFRIGLVTTPANGIPLDDEGNAALDTEHVLETQSIKQFFNAMAMEFSTPLGTLPIPGGDILSNANAKTFDDPRGNDPSSNSLSWCQYTKIWWDKTDARSPDAGVSANTQVCSVLPDKNNPTTSQEFILTDHYVNWVKSFLFKPDQLPEQDKLSTWLANRDWNHLVPWIRELLLVYKYMSIPAIGRLLAAAGNRFEDKLLDMETDFFPHVIFQLGPPRGKPNKYVTERYDNKVDSSIAQLWHNWARNVHYPQAETRARELIQKWSQAVYEQNRDKATAPDPLPAGQNYGSDQGQIDRAKALYDATRDGTLGYWNIPWDT